MKFKALIILFAIVVLNCSNLSTAKSFSLKSRLTRDQTALTQLSREQENQRQVAAFHPDEKRIQERDATGDVVGFLDRPSSHNRTARDADDDLQCVSHIEWPATWDDCRKKSIRKVHCKSQHAACLQAIPKNGKPLCRARYGFREAKYMKNCTSIPIDCECAA